MDGFTRIHVPDNSLSFLFIGALIIGVLLLIFFSKPLWKLFKISKDDKSSLLIGFLFSGMIFLLLGSLGGVGTYYFLGPWIQGQKELNLNEEAFEAYYGFKFDRDYNSMEEILDLEPGQDFDVWARANSTLTNAKLIVHVKNINNVLVAYVTYENNDDMKVEEDGSVFHKFVNEWVPLEPYVPHTL